MTPSESSFLVTAALALGLALVTWWAGRRARRPASQVETAAPPAWWFNKYYWYRLPNGMWSWDRAQRDGRIEYGPLFTPERIRDQLDNRWLVYDCLASGDSVSRAAAWPRDVMCYYLRPRPEDAPREVAGR